MKNMVVSAQARSTQSARKRAKKKPTRQRAQQQTKSRRLMTMRDIAARYGCSEKKIRSLRSAGLLPPPCPLSSGGKYLWHPLVIERWMRSEVEPERSAKKERP